MVFLRKCSPYFILVGLCVLTFFNSLGNDFIVDDYDWYVQRIVDAVHLSPGFFVESVKGFYRPVVFLTYKYLHVFFGENYYGYNVFNLALYSVLCCLFYYILKKLFHSKQLALLATTLYAVHPVNSYLLNYKTGNNASLVAFFMQMSMIFFLRGIDKKRFVWRFLSLLFFAVALLSHPISILLPLYLFLILLFVKRDVELKKPIRFFGPYVVLILIFFLIRFNIHDIRPLANPFNPVLPITVKFATLAQLILWYLFKLFWPTKMVFVWDINLATRYIFLWNIVLASLLGGCLYLIFVKWRKGMNAFALGLFAVSFVLLMKGSFMYSYLAQTAIIEPAWFTFSSIGFFVLMANALLKLKERIPGKLWNMGIILILVSMIVYNHQMNRIWKNETRYADYWLKTNPLNGTAWFVRARQVLLDAEHKGNFVDSKEYQLMFLLAYCYKILGDDQQARMHYLMASEEFEKDLAVQGIFWQRHPFEERKELLKTDAFKMIHGFVNLANQEIYPNEILARGYSLLGYFYQQAGFLDEAIDYYTLAVDYAVSGRVKSAFYLDLGKAWIKKEDFFKAIYYGQLAIQAAPDQVSPYLKTGYFYVLTHNYLSALEYFQKALELAPQDKKIIHNIGMAYSMLKDYPRALHYFNRVLLLDPEDEAARRQVSRLSGGGV